MTFSDCPEAYNELMGASLINGLLCLFYAYISLQEIQQAKADLRSKGVSI